VSPDQFLALYVPILCTWKNELAANEDALIPAMTLDVHISKQSPADAPSIDLCVTSMADDVASTHMALNYGQASETLLISQNSLGKCLETVGMSLAGDKGGILCSFRGFASDCATMLLSSPGKLRNDKFVCYLGCGLQSDGQAGSEVTRRKEKMVSAWWRLKGFRCSRVPSEVKATVFRATVLQAATANSMMFRYTQQRQLSIGCLYNRFLRKLLGRSGYLYDCMPDHFRALTTVQICSILHLPMFAVACRVVRLRWLQSIFKYPVENRMVFFVLFGQFEFVTRGTMPSKQPQCSSAVLQLIEDMGQLNQAYGLIGRSQFKLAELATVGEQ
jgi:hypothetical protein